jgi:alpha-beta hydrolase superfamily lysophospholipase
MVCSETLILATRRQKAHDDRPMERQTVRAEDGFELATIRWLPKGAPRAVLQIVHGMAEHVSRYAPFAEACTAAGIAVYGHDQRGHGSSITETTAPRGHFADEEGWTKVIGDVERVQRHIRAAHPNIPIVLFAHSMGAFVARAFLLRSADSLAGAIISSNGWRTGPLGAVLRWFARREVRKHGARQPSRLMTKLVFGTFNIQFAPTRTRFDWLSRDPAQVDLYNNDPLCGFDCSGKLWDDMLTGVQAIEKEEDDPARLSRTLPLLFIAGTRDPTSMGGIGNGQVAARYRAAQNPSVTDKRYPGARHELLNETNRDEVWRDLLQWIATQLQARSSVAA